MTEFDRHLQQALRATPPLDSARGSAVKEEIMNTYDRKIRIAKWLGWAAIAISVLVFVLCVLVYPWLHSTKALIACAAIAILAGQLELLAKLWYWVFWGRMKTAKDLKELELRIAEIQEQLTRNADTSPGD